MPRTYRKLHWARVGKYFVRWYIIIHVSGGQVPLLLPKIQPRFIRGLIFVNYDSRDAGRQRRICVNAGVFYFAYLFLIFRRNTV